MPSNSGTFGSKPSSFRAFVMSGQRRFGSSRRQRLAHELDAIAGDLHRSLAELTSEHALKLA